MEFKDFKEFSELNEAGYGRNRGYAHGFASPHAPSLGSRHREDDEYHVPDPKPKDEPHAVHINGKKWKSYGSQSHAQNVANKIKGATVHKEEVELDEAQSPQQKMDFEKMMKGAMSRDAYNAKWKTPLKSSSKVIYGKNVKEEVELEEKEHNGKTKVNFTHRNMKEETMPQSFKGFLTSLTELTDKQKKIDKNHNGKLDAQDFKMLRKEDAKCPECGKPMSKCDCDHMSEQSPVAPTLDRKYIKGTPENKAHKEKNKPINGHPTNKMKEEVELDEAFINGREYASHGLMHPDHAKMDIHQPANREVDFYASKTGNKMQGKVMKNDGKQVHIQAHKELGDGKLHKFKVTPHLPKTTNEEAYGNARKAMQKKMKEEFNIEITEEQAADLCDIASLDEKMDMSKADMGDVIKDFKNSDAPQFAGKSDEKRRQMAIAAKLQADRGGKKSYREFVELIAPQIQEGSPDEKEVDVAENAFDWKKSKTSASSGRYDIKQDGNRTIVTRKYNPDTGHSTGTDDEEKPAGEKRGRGRPAGSTSGAKQKGSANKSDYRGIDYKTHSLHLPNSK